MDFLTRKLSRPSKSSYTVIELSNSNGAHERPVPGPVNSFSKRGEPTVGIWRRILPITAIFFTTANAITVWMIRLTSVWGNYELVVNQRVAVQVFIHVVSSILTVIWTYAVCSTINLITRTQFARRPRSVNTLRLWTLISQARLGPNLSLLNFIICAAFCAIAILPAWLWTGALTPQLVTTGMTGNATLPRIGNGAYPFLSPRGTQFFDFECWVVNQSNGSFTSCPGVYQSGSILQSASSATTIDGSPRNHSKFDNTNFRYVGRSYGVGAAVGLTVTPPSTATLQGYSFEEHGYLTTTECIYNSTSMWRFIHEGCGPMDAGGLPYCYYANGCFPNSKWYLNGTCDQGYYAQVSLDKTPDSIVAMGAPNSDNVTDYFLGIAAGAQYHQLDKLQCRFSFQPTVFAVNVSAVNSTISVKPLGDSFDPEPRGMLRSKVMDALNVVSMVQTTLYVSTAGEALKSNIQNYVSRTTGLKSSIGNATSEQVLAAVTDSMQAMADDILMSFASASLTKANAISLYPAHFTQLSVQVGEFAFIIAIVVYQIVALIGILTATIFSKFWSRTPAFDYSEIGAMSTAACLGADQKDASASQALMSWRGKSDDPILGKLQARYRHPLSNEPPIVQICPLDTP